MSDKIDVKVVEPPPRRGKKRTAESSTERISKGHKIYVRAVDGVFSRLRNRLNWILMLSFFILPWFQWGDRQAVWFDLAQQKFHIFGLVLWPQDFVLFAAIFMLAAYALFFVTTFAGRVWCGYTCPQTIWTFIFIWFEEKLEGPRNKRMKLDKQPWSFDKLWRKTAKHTAWLLVSLLTALTFIAIFVPARELFVDFFTLNASGWVSFWVWFFALCTYGNAGWMREIMCLHMCPYSRFQSAMFDKDTFTVSYDQSRGESRGPRSKRADPKELGLGDCIDCALCVQVCPTGIDIRDGLQYECINCGACVDACDEVMEKMNYPKGLISYTTEHQLEGRKTHIVRSKLIGYGVFLLIMTSALVYFINDISPVKLDIIRDRNQLYRENVEGLTENVYTLKLLNKTEQGQRYSLAVEGLPEYEWQGEQQISVAAGEVYTFAISLAVDPYSLDKAITSIDFVVTREGEPGETYQTRQTSRFFAEK